MKTIIIFTTGLIIGMMLCSAVEAGSLRQGFSTTCGERRSVIEHLEKAFSEVPDRMGLAVDGSMIEVLVSPSGTFTIILTRPSGLSCLVAAGEHWGAAVPTLKGPKI